MPDRSEPTCPKCGWLVPIDGHAPDCPNGYTDTLDRCLGLWESMCVAITTTSTHQPEEGVVSYIFVMFNSNTGQTVEVESTFDAISGSHHWTEGWHLSYTKAIEPIMPLVVLS